jgi:8-oxo-dGTP diphosphatase
VDVVQRVTNCVFIHDQKVLLLQKPRRGWWVAPGGKMEQGESIREAVIREYREETGIYLRQPSLKGVFTFVIKDGTETVSEWMMFTFISNSGDGAQFDQSDEGELSWHSIQKLKELPMAEGDYHILDYVIHGNGMIYGNFTYTPDFELLSYRLDPS